MPQFVPSAGASSSSSSSGFIEVSSQTWSKESHNLFDFEAKEADLHIKTFSARETVVFVRNQDEVDMVSVSPQSASSRTDKLVQLTRDAWGRFALQRPRLGGHDDRKIRCWRLIREKEGSEHTLIQGDIIKFGRSQFRVRQLSLNENSDTQLDITCCQTPAATQCSPCVVDANMQPYHCPDQPCRICLFDESTPEDPLLAPCKCKGSVQNIHMSCLRQWVRGRLGLDEGEKAFVYNDLCCELCKSPYQTTIQKGRTKIPLIEVSSAFITLESISDGRLFVLPFKDGKPVKIGRGHDCDMNIQDTSISRLQASIELENGKFVLKDSGSRFGTYIKITKPWGFEDGTQITVQVGRTLLRLSSKLATNESSDESVEDFHSATSSLQGDDDVEKSETETVTKSAECWEQVSRPSGRQAFELLD